MGGWLLLGIALPLAASAEMNSSLTELEIGRRIYQEGVLPSGAPLHGVRMAGSVVSGTEAACVNCHRRSGMGGVEGDIQVSPINGRFLFAQLGDKALATMDPRVGKRMNQAHAPYNDESLGTAIRRGINNSGREMSAVMPRYTLDEPEMKALTAYLSQLSGQWSPGVTAETIRFATVIAPDVEPERRKVLIDMMRTAFNQKNGSTVTASNPRGRRHMTSAAEFVLGTERKWELDIWELQGPPESWGGQLDELYRQQPVFALVSGVSNSTWQPVHDFCEREKVPCWFPSVDLPPVTQAFYPVYFSRGVALEAGVLARHLTDKGRQRPQRLVQIYRDDTVGRAAASALTQALAGSGIAVEDRVLSEGSSEALRNVMAGIGPKDKVMFWLRPVDMSALGNEPPPAASYFSAVLSGGEQGPFSAAWKRSARLVYPYELPDKRQTNLAYFHQWLEMRKLALVDEPLQSEVFFALNFLTDMVAEMLDNLYRDYLMERAETMISKYEGGKAEEQARARDALRPAARSMAVAQAGMDEKAQSGSRSGTTIYPRLSLGPTQRFASKGGYIVRFASPSSDALVAESGWIVP
ncbi:cytochrome c [Ferrigenium kumadai]|uniref:Cytochrome c n=2 Tax=Ferrigenium kumadai TaxID=1682490 RepID=A0AAN1SZL6_9PROT|nr:cytochrome c [Ferrigenium kumadai]